MRTGTKQIPKILLVVTRSPDPPLVVADVRREWHSNVGTSSSCAAAPDVAEPGTDTDDNSSSLVASLANHDHHSIAWRRRMGSWIAIGRGVIMLFFVGCCWWDF